MILNVILYFYSPFDVGFEALGQIVAAGSSVSNEKIGQYVIYTQYGAFAEYVEISARAVIPIPVSNKAYRIERETEINVKV